MELAVSVIGGFAISHAGRPVDIPIRKAQALLAYVVLSPTAEESREKLSGLLWSGASERQARASLRQVLRRIRSTLDKAVGPVVEITRDIVRVDRSALSVDLWSVIESAKAGWPDETVLRLGDVGGSLLSGLDDLDPSFQSWLTVQRQVLQEQIVFALQERLTEVRIGTPGEDAARVKTVATALLAADPTHEVACRELMLVQANEGDVAGALRRYNTLWNLLDSDYDMEPSEETQDLVAQIKIGEITSSPVTAPPVVPPVSPRSSSPSSASGSHHGVSHPPHRLRLVIGEFTLDGIDPARRYLAEGFRYQLISSLVRFREWSVLDGRRSALEAPSAPPNHTTYLVNALSYETDELLRIVVTLSDCHSGEVIWSEDFAAGLANWFATQRQFVRKLAVVINVQISVERVSRLIGKAESPLSIYDLWLKGQDLAQRWRPEERLEATQIFQKIIDEAPEFCPAYCSLVNFMNSQHLIFPGVYREEARTSSALDLAKKAVQTGPTNSRAHLCSAWSFALSGLFDQAELSYQMAHELNENDPWTLTSSSLGLAFCGDRATTQARLTAIIDLGLTTQPLHWCYQVVCRFLCEDYEGAVWASARTEDAIYNIPAWTAAALSQLGRVEEAHLEARRFVDLVRLDWHGDQAASDQTVTDWLLHSFPIRQRADWERLRDGLAIAGLPAGSCEPWIT